MEALCRAVPCRKAQHSSKTGIEKLSPLQKSIYSYLSDFVEPQILLFSMVSCLPVSLWEPCSGIMQRAKEKMVHLRGDAGGKRLDRKKV